MALLLNEEVIATLTSIITDGIEAAMASIRDEQRKFGQRVRQDFDDLELELKLEREARNQFNEHNLITSLTPSVSAVDLTEPSTTGRKRRAPASSKSTFQPPATKNPFSSLSENEDVPSAQPDENSGSSKQKAKRKKKRKNQKT